VALVLDPQRTGQLERAAASLRSGLPVSLPTETVYGLAARAFDPAALARVFALKARPTFDPLIVHVRDAREASLCARLEPIHRRLIEKFWPGPLTFLAPKTARVPDLCTSGSPFVALRSPSHPVFRRVLEILDEPLSAPSANRFGRISPVTADDVVQELGPHGLEAVVDGGACELGLESTIVRVADDGAVEVLRPGSLSVEALRAGLGASVPVRVIPRAEGVAAPGLLASHYAPRKPLVFLPDASAALPAGLEPPLWAFVSAFPTELSARGWKEARVLSAAGSDVEAAAKLFATLRSLDAGSSAGIVALGAPDAGLGLALNDRLKRAAAPRGENA
jgi:L-threonylcarbamoyladenylate synthase